MNPFEIRLDILKLARDTLVEQYHQQYDHLTQKWHMECDYAKQCGHPLPEKPQPLPYPNASTIMAEAERMYEFVSKKQ